MMADVTRLVMGALQATEKPLAITPCRESWPTTSARRQMKTPVTEEFRRLAFEGVADELKDPSGDEECERDSQSL